MSKRGEKAQRWVSGGKRIRVGLFGKVDEPWRQELVSFGETLSTIGFYSVYCLVTLTSLHFSFAELGPQL